MAEGEKEGEAMHVHEEYWNPPYQPPILTLDQQQQSEKGLVLITQKEVYPYEYMDSFERFQEPQLLTKDTFYSSLTKEDISDIDYTHTQRVFNHFDMTDLRDYHSFNLLIDVFLLADGFENFRSMCLQHYRLNPADNYTSPGLSWQAAFKITDVELNLLTDIDQHLLIEEEIRRRMAIISQRYTPANVPDMENKDPNKRNSYIMYLDVNNLYR